MNYIINILIAIDQLFTTIFGGFPDETMSSYAFRMENQRKPWGFMRKVIDWIFFWTPNHCYESYLDERNRKQLPPEFRG